LRLSRVEQRRLKAGRYTVTAVAQTAQGASSDARTQQLKVPAARRPRG
jgi:hypothetical protein